MPIHLDIVTPEKMVFSREVENVYLPGADGELGVLPMHSKLVTALQPGNLRYQCGGVTHHMAVGSGFAEIMQDRIVVLTDMALGEDEIDIASMEEAINRAKERLVAEDKGMDSEEIAYLQAAVARAGAAINFKRRRSNGGAPS